MNLGKRKRSVGIRSALVLALFLCIPGAIGGCPDFRNEAVTAFETAARGVIDAALDLAFDSLRTDDAG